MWQLLHYCHSPLSFFEACSRRYGDPFTVRWAGYSKTLDRAIAGLVQEMNAARA